MSTPECQEGNRFTRFVRRHTSAKAEIARSPDLSSSPELARMHQMLEQLSTRITALEQASPPLENPPASSDNPNAALLRGEQSLIMGELIDRLNLTNSDKKRLWRDYGDLIDAIANTSGGVEALAAAGSDPVKLKLLLRSRTIAIFNAKKPAKYFKSAIDHEIDRELEPLWRDGQLKVMNGLIDKLDLTARAKKRLRRSYNLIGIIERMKRGTDALAEAEDDPDKVKAVLKSYAEDIFNPKSKYVNAINKL